MYSILLLIIQYVDAKDLFSYSYTYTLDENGAIELKSIKCNNPVISDENSVVLWLSIYVTFKRIQQIALDASKITDDIYNDA